MNHEYDFGTRAFFPENIKTEVFQDQTKLTEKIYIQMAERYEALIIAEIAKAAAACGATETLVLNKQLILDALGKQVPQAPDLEGDGYSNGQLVYDTGICPRCRHSYEIEYHMPRYCENCGQALAWEELNV